MTYSFVPPEEKRTADSRPCMGGDCTHLNRYHTEEGCIIAGCGCKATRV